MRKTLASLLLASTLLPLSAFAQGVYVAPRLGYGTLHGTFKEIEPGYQDYKIGSQSKGSAILGVAAGYDFKKQFSLPIRAELEYAWLGDSSKNHTQTVSDWWGDATAKYKATLGGSTLFANTYFDFHNTSAVTPYVSVGLGYSFLTAKGKATYTGTFLGVPGTETLTYGKKTSNNFAWNLGVGAAWKVTDSVALELGYRYANLGKAKTGYDEDGAWWKTNNVTTHQFLFGGRFSF